MTSNQEASNLNTPVNFPTIHLDKTLTDLYATHCPSLQHKRLGHIFCGTTSASDLSPAFPRNRKYVYQDSAFNDASFAQKSDAEIQQSLAPKYLSLVPQRDAFIAGPAPVIFFYSGASTAEREHDERETASTLAVLDQKQRPNVLFYAGPSGVVEPGADHGIDVFSSKLVVDEVAEASFFADDGRPKMLVHPDVVWYVNSKAALATCGLPTPKSEIIQVHGHCPDARSCCEACEAALPDDQRVPDDCVGPRQRWIGEQTLRILSALGRQPLPFVFKNQQAFAGAGTYVITTGPERNQLFKELTTGGILQRMLCQINKDNEHLQPGTVLLTTMIRDPLNDYGITFFVGEGGSSEFLAASKQMIDRESASWIGSSICYPHQVELENKFGSMVSRTAAWLSKEGYIGVAGIDILESKAGDLQIVDMNVRTSGSLCLPLMKTHFTSRGFDWASSLSVTVRDSREVFARQWRTEIESGQMCILAWYEDDGVGKSFGDVVVGAKDEETLAGMLKKVREATEQVTF